MKPLAERLASLPPLPKPPEPPADLDETGAECWRGIAAEMKDYRQIDLTLLRTACRWYSMFLEASKRALDERDDGQRWKYLTEASMCSKQFQAVLRLAGLAKSGRHAPSKLARAQAMEE